MTGNAATAPPRPHRDHRRRAAVTALDWGYRYLMCPPRHYGVRYEINPWMHADRTVDLDAAQEQWEGLRRVLVDAGAEVETIDQPEGLPDLVFTANAGVLDAGARIFVPSHFRHPERRPETEVFASWFAARGWELHQLPIERAHEGAGDALPGGDVLISGHGARSDEDAGAELARLLDVAVRSVALVDERLYHLDLTFCPLDDRRAMCAPLGWSTEGCKAVEELVAEPLWLEDDEALSFCANSVVVGSRVIMPTCPPRVGRTLEAWGFEVEESPVGEFLKAGGGCRCLTLALDVNLSAG